MEKYKIESNKDLRATVWPNGHREDAGGLGDFSWFFHELAIKTASPWGGRSVCSWESFALPRLNFFPAVGHGSSSAQDSRRQQKCVVSKCTWHFSSTTQLLSELATCASERKGKWGAPKCCPWSLLTLQEIQKTSPWCFYRKEKRNWSTSSPPQPRGDQGLNPAPGPVLGTGEGLSIGERGWERGWSLPMLDSGTCKFFRLSPHPELSVLCVNVTTSPFNKNWGRLCDVLLGASQNSPDRRPRQNLGKPGRCSKLA